MVKEYFARCEAWFPEQRTQLRQVSLALRREGIHTMEQLRLLRGSTPGRLTAIRAIGTKRLALIEQVCAQYEAERCPAVSYQERQEGIL